MNLPNLLAALALAAPPQMPKIVEPPAELATAGPAVSVVGFRSEDYLWSARRGTGSLRGEAFMRTRGGSLRTCAGYEVLLWPLGDYTADYLRRVYGALEEGYADASTIDARKVLKVDQRLAEFVRTVKCNLQGQFEFVGLPQGRYAVTTTVVWEVPGLATSRGGAMQGGGLVGLVTVSAGVTTVSLSR